MPSPLPSVIEAGELQLQLVLAAGSSVTLPAASPFLVQERLALVARRPAVSAASSIVPPRVKAPLVESMLSTSIKVPAVAAIVARGAARSICIVVEALWVFPARSVACTLRLTLPPSLADTSTPAVQATVPAAAFQEPLLPRR